MLNIQPELLPSSLLWLDDEPNVVHLREECRDVRNPSRAKLDEWHQRVDRWADQSPVSNTYALGLICLADEYRQSAMPAVALQCCNKATWNHRRWTRIENLHNHAVAHFALARAQEDIPDTAAASETYRQAYHAFRDARKMWITKGNRALWVARCEEAMDWIERRRQDLTGAAPIEPTPEPQRPVRVLGRIAAGDFTQADEDIEGEILVDVDRARGVSFALRVQGDSMIDEGINSGDLVLIEVDPSVPTEGEIVAVIIEGFDSEATLKKCYKEVDHYRLEPANENEPFRILKKGSVPEGPIRARYRKSHPRRVLKFYSDVQPRVVGWMRGVIPGTEP